MLKVINVGKQIKDNKQPVRSNEYHRKRVQHSSQQVSVKCGQHTGLKAQISKIQSIEGMMEIMPEDGPPIVGFDRLRPQRNYSSIGRSASRWLSAPDAAISWLLKSQY
ncbi:MAG: hypothetical protein ACK58T_05910, partial [Phycisphaerae bacterium]